MRGREAILAAACLFGLAAAPARGLEGFTTQAQEFPAGAWLNAKPLTLSRLR